MIINIIYMAQERNYGGLTPKTNFISSLNLIIIHNISVQTEVQTIYETIRLHPRVI